jgi:hypothetical protein
MNAAARPDFFANDPFPPGVAHVDPVLKDEDRFLHCARWLVTACLSGKHMEWLSCPEFRELCALIGMSAEPPAEDDLRPDIPLRYRRVELDETIQRGDKWRPLRRTPSSGVLNLPFETVPEQLVGQTVRRVRASLRALFVRPLRLPAALTSGA